MSQTTGEKPVAKVCIYGGSGDGKSHLVLDIIDKVVDKEKALLWVDTSDNVLIAPEAKRNGLLNLPWQRVPFTFLEDLELIANAIKEKHPPFDMIGAIFLDEASKMVQEDVDRVYNERFEKGSTKAESPDFTDARISTVRFRRILATLYQCEGLHVFMTAHEFVPGMMSKETKRRADFHPAVYKFAKEKLSVLARLTADEIKGTDSEAIYKRTVQIHPTTAADAKSRLGTPLVKFDAEYLADGIKQWLDSGGVEAPEIVEAIEETTPMPEQPEEFEAIEDFNPIN